MMVMMTMTMAIRATWSFFSGRQNGDYVMIE